jgi:hypothetical protein
VGEMVPGMVFEARYSTLFVLETSRLMVTVRQ